MYLDPGRVGGTETYAAGLIPALLHHQAITSVVAFVAPSAAAWSLPDDRRISRVVCRSAGHGPAARYATEQLLLPRLAREHGIDLLHSLGYTSPVRPATPAVVTVHDLNFIHLGHLMAPSRRLALQTIVPAGMRAARAILTDSQASAQQISERWPQLADRVHVAYCGTPPVPSVPAPPANGTARPYLLAMSSASPHKNIERLLEAWRQLWHRGVRSYDLVLVGHVPAGWSADALPEGVRQRGWLPQDELDGTLRAAAGLVFPSLYEGFGLPLLEAMARGVPVASSNVFSLPEVGGDAALYFDPENTTEMAHALQRLITDTMLRQSLAEAGVRNAARFTWEACATATVAAYQDAVADGR